MDTNRKTTTATGILFLIALIAYATGDALITVAKNKPEYLIQLTEYQHQVRLGTLLLLVNSLAVAMIGVLMFTRLKQQNFRVALLYLCARIMESVTLIVGMISLALLITPGRTHGNTGLAGITYLETLATLVTGMNYFAYQTAMIILGSGSAVLFVFLYQARLLPRFMSAWGIIGYALLAAGAVAEVFGYPVGVLLAVPGGIFEIALAIWLIAKGFNASSANPIALA